MGGLGITFGEAFDKLKKAYELAKRAQNIELQEKLLDVKEAFQELREEHLASRERVQQLEEALQARENVRFDGNVYWDDKPEPRHPDDGPYCPTCLDRGFTASRVRLHREADTAAEHEWFCYVCRVGFGRNPNYTPPPIGRAATSRLHRDPDAW